MTKRGRTVSVPPSRERGEGAPGPIRCAIYTRKSSEEGLELEFNSLDAQREAAESYIASQRNEGWICLPDRYDDGGFSGGSMERPALAHLLKEIEAGKVDCVVVYKVDRLSRSLMDFARIMETFDRKGVSFVSVTQQFNTTSSMGRLTLNILLSFAQFEREIIGERIRDKIAAQKRRGKWAGGVPILGYDVDRSGSSPPPGGQPARGGQGPRDLPDVPRQGLAPADRDRATAPRVEEQAPRDQEGRQRRRPALQHGHPHMLSPSVLGATRNHPMLWHAIRDLPHSVLVYRGVWDQSGPGFLTRVVRDHGHFRDVVPFHWALFEQGEEAAKAHGGAFAFVQAKPAEVVA